MTEAGLADIEASCRAPREGDRSAAAGAPLWGAARERGSRQNFRLQQGVLDTTVTLRRDDAREERFWIVGAQLAAQLSPDVGWLALACVRALHLI